MCAMLKTPEESRTRVLKKLQKAFIPREQQPAILANGRIGAWIFDFRPSLLDGETLDLVCELTWDALKAELPYQIGGLETAAIAYAGGMLIKAREHDHDLSGFYIRKSRRKDGLQQQIEGNLTDEKIVLIDDTINSGRSFMRQIEALEAAGKKVSVICVLVRYRDESFYAHFEARGIKVISLFTLDDFPQSGGIKKQVTSFSVPRPERNFDVQWKFASPEPSYYYVVPKSSPVIDTEHLYFGADNGVFWALNQSDGSVAWKYQTLFGAQKKRIFSSPAVLNNIVYFGAYDGNFYALDTQTGAKKWIYREADWIGSSPCIDESTQSVLIGLEFGLWKKQGGLAALDLQTGKKKWWLPIETMVHSSPAVSAQHRIAVAGSSSGLITAIHAKTGTIAWTYQTGGAVRAGFAVHEKLGLVCAGSSDRHVYIFDVKTGAVVHKIETLEPIYSTPLIHEDRLYFGLLDKRVMCIDLKTGEVIWTYWTHSRVFATPVIVGDSLFIGSNDGRLYELDPLTGDERGYTQFTERIVNKIAYNPATKHFFVPTYANEIFCLTRTQSPETQPAEGESTPTQ